MSTFTENNMKKLSTMHYKFAYKGFDKETPQQTFWPDKSKDDTEKDYFWLSINVLLMFKTFYSIQGLEAIAKPDTFLKSNERWHEDFINYSKWFYKQFRLMLSDYSVAACFGEMRHMYNHSAKKFNHPYFEENQQKYRDLFIMGGIPFTRESIIKAGDKVFNNSRNSWRGSFGGNAWSNIVKAQFLDIEGQEAVYIDHCIDLEHNCGTYFNKEFIFFLTESPKEYLDFKRAASVVDVFRQCPCREVQDLIIRANTLGIIEPLPENFYFKGYMGQRLLNGKWGRAGIEENGMRFANKETERSKGVYRFKEWTLTEAMMNYLPIQFGDEDLDKVELIDSFGNTSSPKPETNITKHRRHHNEEDNERFEYGGDYPVREEEERFSYEDFEGYTGGENRRYAY